MEKLQQWQKIKEIVGSALERPAGERSAYLEEVCSQDSALRAEVESLLAAYTDADKLSESPWAVTELGKPPIMQARFVSGALVAKRYRIVTAVGQGGMGEVYRAEDLRLGQTVALKFLPNALAHIPDAWLQVEREVRIARPISHPNVCRVFDIGESDDGPFITMEFIDGEDLASLLKRIGRLHTDKGLQLARQLFAGLAAAHEIGIVHRDLKPANIMIDGRGRLRITDFGLAALFEELRKEQLREGTPAYMAPEQLGGGEVTPRTDVYAAGLVTYELFSGHQAFPSTKTLDEHHLPPQPLSRIVHDFDSAIERIINRCLDPDPEARPSAAEVVAALPSPSGLVGPATHVRRGRSKLGIYAAAAITGATLIAVGLHYRSHQRKPLTEKDTIVLADFTNMTGDSVFDDTLKQGLSISLEQSPFLNILSDEKTKQTLTLMGRPSGERINSESAREVCQRTESRAVLTGSISSLGTEYVVGLNALDCRTGDQLAQEQVQTQRKEDVLKALDRAATQLREKLGESLATVQQFDTPLFEATTPSLEALKAYSLGQKALLEQGATDAIPFYERAKELDPNFALAYNQLGTIYGTLLMEPGTAEENIRNAYRLRDRVSERERFMVDGNYYGAVTGEMDKAVRNDELWAQTYPRDGGPYNSLAADYELLGLYDKSMGESLLAIQFYPAGAVDYSNLMEAYTALNRLDEAKNAYQQAIARKLENPFLHDDMYAVAFLAGDAGEMKHQVELTSGKPGAEDLLLSAQSDTEAYRGHLRKARELSRQAVDSALRSNLKETAALWELNAALREAEFGIFDQARRLVKNGLTISSTRDVQTLAALVLASVGDAATAQPMLETLEKQYPLNTFVNQYWLPTIRAYNDFHRGNPRLALKLLEVAARYDLAFPQPWFEEGPQLYPVYVRGKAYLLLNHGNEAANEFRKMLGHPGLLINSPLRALAQLQLGRALVMQGDTAAGRKAYQDFLVFWNEADPDIPILKQAKAEYAKLQ